MIKNGFFYASLVHGLRPCYFGIILPNFGAVGGSKIVGRVRKFFCTFWVRQSPIGLKGVLGKNLQKPYICGWGGYNSWDDGAYHVDTLGPTKTQGYRIVFWMNAMGIICLGATQVLQVFINKAF